MPSNEKKSEKKSLVKSGLVLSLMTLASRIMGLVREMTKAAFLGTGFFADCFTVAFMLPNLLRRLFAESAISVAFIPTFKDYLENEKKSDRPEEVHKSTQEFIASTFTLVTFLTTCVVVIAIIITPFIISFFCKKPAEGVADFAEKYQYWLNEKSEITILTRIMFPYLFLISVAAFFQGILNGCKIFAPSGFTPVLFNAVVVISTYILAPHTSNPARAMAIGTILGGLVQALFQWPFLKKTGWKVGIVTLEKAFTNPGTRRVLALILPTIVGLAAYQVNDVVSTAMAKRLTEGIASSLGYSLRIQELILGIFAVSIGTVILPDLSGLANNQNWEAFNRMLLQAIKIMTVIALPVTAYSLVTGKEIISLLFKSKAFDDASVMLTLGEFRFHMLGLIFIALNRVISPAFYAQKNSKLPTIAGLVSFAANILFVLILSKPMEGNGIALALTIGSFANTVFLFIFMKKLEAIKVWQVVKGTLLYALKISLYSIIAALPCYFLRPVLNDFFAGHNRLVTYGAPAFILAAIFGLIGIFELAITKDEIARAIFKKVKK